MPGLIGYAPPHQASVGLLSNAPPEFQSVAERDAWYRAHPVTHNNSPNAPAFQPQNPNDPFYQRSDIAPLMQATTRDVMGNGQYGIRGWMRDHPLGVLGAFGALAAGGAALTGGLGSAGGAAAGGADAGAAAADSGLGIFANNGAAGLAGVGGGNAGALAASGGIAGGAGIGGTSAGALGGLLTPGNVKSARQFSGLLGGDQQAAPAAQSPQVAPRDNRALVLQLQREARAQELRKKINRTPEEEKELRELTLSSLLG